DRAKLSPATALLSAASISIPLAVGEALGHPGSGAAVAAGAFLTSFPSFVEGYRKRATAMLLASVGVAGANLIGTVAAHGDAATVAVTTVAGFLAGFLVVLGSGPAIVGVVSMLSLLIAGQIPTSIGGALVTSALLLAGGLFQTALLVGAWPLERFPVERRVLGHTYRSLAAYAAGLGTGSRRAPDPDILAHAQVALDDPQPFLRGRATVEFRALYDEALRIRSRLAALCEERTRLDDDGVIGAVTGVRAVAAAAAEVLDDVGAALERRRLPTDLAASRHRLRHAAMELERAADKADDAPDAAMAGAVADTEALLGQLRSVMRIVTAPSDDRGPVSAEAALDPVSEPDERTSPGRLRLVAIVMRANLTLSSSACRHALRLAVTVGVATLLYRVLPGSHSYWLPVTVLMVLKPDFSTTFVRGLGRVAGTLAGAVLATLLAATLHPGPAALTVLVVLMAFGAFTFYPANYGVYAVFLTGLVVFLVAFGGVPTDQAVVNRAFDTVAGGALALLAYAVWPTWESTGIPQRLARLLEAESAFGTMVLRSYVDAKEPDPAPVETVRRAAALARSNAEASVTRMLSEPSRHGGVDGQIALGIVSGIHRYVLGAVTLFVHLPDVVRRPLPALEPLTDDLDAAMSCLASSVRTGDPPPQLDVRRAHMAFTRAIDERRHGAAGSDASDATAVVTETDLMVDSVDGMAELLASRR
ncbi:MAG TPA: FUSC family protein, partial [Acidimicrobiales bacterium]